MISSHFFSDAFRQIFRRAFWCFPGHDFHPKVFRRFFRHPVSPQKCGEPKLSYVRLGICLHPLVENSMFFRTVFFRQLSDTMFTDVFCMPHNAIYEYRTSSKVPLTNVLGPKRFHHRIVQLVV